MNKKFKKVAVLMGGPSAEREVSLRSGAAIAKGLREAGYDAVEVDIKNHEVILPGNTDAAFVALHGEFGEDGQIQEILTEKGIPYTGSGPESSRNSFDKLISKDIFVKNGIPTPKFQVIKRGQKPSLALPIVVKPPRQGSSLGVHRIFGVNELSEALEDAFKFDDDILVEEFIEGSELTVGIVNDRALPVIEIRAPGGWYNYKAKYTTGQTQYIVPAPLDKNIYKECQIIAEKTFSALGCEGMGRVDFRCTDKGKLYVLELNNIPGFTETSLLPKAAAYEGTSFAKLCESILESASI